MRNILLVFLCTIAFSTVFFLGGCSKSGQELARLQKQNDSLRDALTAQHDLPSPAEATGDTNRISIPSRQWWQGFEHPGLPAGISSPDSLVSYLNTEHSDLLPYGGVLGGTMFWENAMFVGENWVLAMLSDGHVLAFALLEYTSGTDGGLRWKVLEKHRM